MQKETSAGIDLYLIRYGESLANISQSLEKDSDLTEKGRDQSRTAGLALVKTLEGLQPEAIIHTGLKRTFGTASIIKEQGVFNSPLVEMKDFREREMGIFEQMDFATFLNLNFLIVDNYHCYGGSCVWFFEGQNGQGVESLVQMEKRIRIGLAHLTDIFQKGPLILVAHAGSIKMIRAVFELPINLALPEYLSSYVPKNGEIYKMSINRQE